MRSYYFAGYRLDVTDDLIKQTEDFLINFTFLMPDTHTFTLRSGNDVIPDELYTQIATKPAICRAGRISIYATADKWVFLLPESYSDSKTAVLCTKDYADITVYRFDKTNADECLKEEQIKKFPFTTLFRYVFEAGFPMRDGLPMHAALIEKNGEGIIFLGRSGAGKSTQTKLWQKYRNALIICGDRMVLRKINGTWYGCGLPWDGKDHIHMQKCVPIKAIAALEQADHNEITLMSPQQTMAVMLHQTSLPMWDTNSVNASVGLIGKMAHEILCYHLKNLADEACVSITYDMIFGG